MKTRKILALCTVIILVILCSAALVACGNGGSGGGNGGGGTQTTVPTGNYLLTSSEYVVPVEFGSFDIPILLETDNEYSQVSGTSKITINANDGISFINVGSFAVSFTQGEGSGLSGTSFDMKFVTDGSGYKVVKKIDSSATLATTSSSQNTMLGGDSFYKMCTFTYADDVITLTMRYELVSDRDQGWTQTYTYTKE